MVLEDFRKGIFLTLPKHLIKQEIGFFVKSPEFYSVLLPPHYCSQGDLVNPLNFSGTLISYPQKGG